MYLLCWIVLFFCLYLLPGLAVFPKALFSPHFAYGLVPLSAFVLYLITSVGIGLGIFDTDYVWASAISLSVIAVIRVVRVAFEYSPKWSPWTLRIYGLNALIVLPYFFKLGVQGFDASDEIYSWNFWAYQMVVQHPIDFSHTGAPYPLLFSKFLAYGYQLVGNIDAQLPMKSLLGWFSYSLLCAIGMQGAHRHNRTLWMYLLLVAWVLFAVNIQQFWDNGLADPIMSACLVCSIGFYLKAERYPKQTLGFYSLSLACGLSAMACKQPALLWTAVAFPVLAGFWGPKNAEKRWCALLAFILSGLWLLWEGAGFWNNTGVLQHSLAQRGWGAQLAYAFTKYALWSIPSGLFLGLVFWVGFKYSLTRKVMIFFMLPSLCFWWLFGAYHLRLGQHWFMCGLLILSACRYRPLMSKLRRFSLPYVSPFWGYAPFTGVFLAIWFVWEYVPQAPKIPLMDAFSRNLYQYFGSDYQRLMDQVHKTPTGALWVPSRYLYGLFYPRAHLLCPDYREYADYRLSSLSEDLLSRKPFIVFTVNPYMIDGPANQALKEVIQLCPEAFEPISLCKTAYAFSAYHFKWAPFNTSSCQQKIKWVSNKG